MKTTLSLALAAFAAAVAASAAPTNGALVLTHPRPAPEPMEEAWRGAGLEIRRGLDAPGGASVAAVYLDGLAIDAATAAKVSAHAERGAALILATGPRGVDVPDDFASRWLPVNAWSMKGVLRRGACELDSRAFAPDAKSRVAVSYRFDMHLPLAPIESPLFRYRPEKYAKDPARFTRTSIAARMVGEGALPVLIDADAGPSRVVLFASDFGNPLLRSSPGYADWAKAVALMPFGAKLPAAKPFAPGDASDWARDAARRPFAIALEEDETTIGELAPTPQPREGVDGVTSRRYVYRPGTAPKVTLRLRNRFNNIAPLAEASDIAWPENPSARGLNDMAFTHSSVRGRLPIHAVWCGRSAAEQRVALKWPEPATVAGVRLTGFGSFRHWDRSNPRRFTLSADGRTLLSEADAEYAPSASEERAFFERIFDAPARVAGPLVLAVTGLDAHAKREPKCDGVPGSNAALAEWEAWGWCGEADAAAKKPAELTLTAVRVELETGKRTRERVPAAKVRLAFCSEKKVEMALTPLGGFGPVRWIFTLTDDAGEVVARENFDCLFVPAEGNKIRPKIGADTAEIGLLCTPGWRNTDSFGIGMNRWCAGWGGPNDQNWAASLDMMEYGADARDDPARMFATPARPCHYTNPWRRFPNGRFSWNWVAERLLAKLAPDGELGAKGVRNLHVVGSDRWNGVPVNASFAWDDFVRFDQWLKAKGKPGLEARSRTAIAREIRERRGDDWQRFEMETYARLMDATERAFAAKGRGFKFETHGAFPYCGGALGARLAKTHRGVGTDVFWILERQDLWRSLGARFAPVAVNPDLESGAYDQWGWVNSEQNEFWFSSSGDDATARRQWYATYFLGRVTSKGAFRPFHEFGYGQQGTHGVRYTAKDHAARCRVHGFASEVRPEAAAGFGVVVSWKGQERRMGPKTSRMGFGLYPADGEPDAADMFRDVYAGLVREGVPVSFVTSADALAEWKGASPLILVDGANWSKGELAAADAAERRGVKVFKVSPDGMQDSTTARRVAKEIMSAAGEPLRCSRGLAVTPFVSYGRLFLAVCRQGDETSPAEIVVKPGLFHAPSANSKRVVSLDDGAAAKVSEEDGGALRVRFPMEASSGRVLMFSKGGAK